MLNKKVSIIVPIYNTEKYLERCIQSILHQTYNNLELILVNDGSSGNEDSIILKYKDLDPRIVYIKKEANCGLFLGRMSGLERANGEYISFVDSDDYIGVDFIRLLVDEIERSEADIVFSKTAIRTEKGDIFENILQEVSLSILPVIGDDVKRAYYGQEGSAFVWHTVWNKLYRKSLWEQCYPHLKKLNEHIVMTEDVAFSSVAFYFANKVSRADNATYYYCQNDAASTSTKNLTIEQYIRRLNNIIDVFSFVENFLNDVGADANITHSFLQFKKYYGRLWERGLIQIDGEDLSEAKALIESFCPDSGNEMIVDDEYFNMIQVPYKDQLEAVKNQIVNSDCEYISFDMFDTLITRPFYKPTDLFYLLDKKYEELEESNVSFHKIRTEGEAGARRFYNNIFPEKEDVTLTDIYNYIADIYGIPQETCRMMMEEEKRLELRFCRIRRTGKELYDIAQLTGKRVMIISDMYLEDYVLEDILNICGYTKHHKLYVSSKEGKLKRTGSLYKVVLADLGITGEKLLHIGDNHEGDIKSAKRYNIQTIYFPKALDVFENRVEGLSTNRCSSIARNVGGAIRDNDTFIKKTGFSSMIALVANTYFDNPFRAFHPITDFNIDPWLVGYYTLGMHLMGIVTWLHELLKKDNRHRIVFMARDGYLVKKAFDIYKKILNLDYETEYIYASRKSMLASMLQGQADFMSLPIVYGQYNPLMIMQILGFCCKDNSDRILDEGGEFNLEKPFRDIFEYQQFMQFFYQRLYDADKHKKAVELRKEYFAGINSEDLIYDTGYSASIHKALVDTVGHKPQAVFIHADNSKNRVMTRRGNFDIETFYDMTPSISGLIREHFFSDICGSCIDYQKIDGITLPVLEDEKKRFSDKFPILIMQDAALEFIKDYCNYFKDYMDYIPISKQDLALPFEGFLRLSKKIDKKFLMASYFEDRLYGALEKVNILDFIVHTILSMPVTGKADMAQDYASLIKEKGKSKLAFFGTGRMCHNIQEKYNLPVDLYLDNDREKRGKRIGDTIIMNPYEVKDIHEYYIVIVCAAYHEIQEQLEEMGLKIYSDFMNYMEFF